MHSWDKRTVLRYNAPKLVFKIFQTFILYSGLADYQCCDSFRWIAKGCISILILASHLNLATSCPGCHIILSRVLCAIKVGSCWLYTLNIAMCTCLSQTFYYFPLLPTDNHKSQTLDCYKAAVRLLHVIWTLITLLHLYFKLSTNI